MASPISQVAKTRDFLVMRFLSKKTVEANSKPALHESPARCFSHEIFLPQAEHHTGTHREDRFLHREDVLLHSRHVELVLALIGEKELAPRGHIGNFGGALDND